MVFDPIELWLDYIQLKINWTNCNYHFYDYAAS